jgi:hypothetical protein
MSVSLDGYVEGPHHELDWHLVDDEFNAYAVAMLKASDVRKFKSGNVVLIYEPTPR